MCSYMRLQALETVDTINGGGTTIGRHSRVHQTPSTTSRCV
jgi:hypothetical protein